MFGCPSRVDNFVQLIYFVSAQQDGTSYYLGCFCGSRRSYKLTSDRLIYRLSSTVQVAVCCDVTIGLVLIMATAHRLYLLSRTVRI